MFNLERTRIFETNPSYSIESSIMYCKEITLEVGRETTRLLVGSDTHTGLDVKTKGFILLNL